MADKFRKTYPLKITFSSAEQPTSAKLSAISEQTRNGLAIIEQALGDPWNQSGDTLLSDYPLQIPNLARIIGETKYLNPAIYPMNAVFRYKERIGSKYTGRNEGYLLFKPKASGVFTTDGTGGAAIVDGQKKASEGLVAIDGDWWVDEATGRFRTYLPLQGSEVLRYQVDPLESGDEWIQGQETLPGIIPDPRQAKFTSCNLEKSGATYLLHLPPRQPLENIDDARERPVNYPADIELDDNKTTAKLVDSNYMFWQSHTVDAFTGTDSAFYRYALPKEIQDAGLSPGEEIPAGYLHLYDKSTGTMIDDVTFKIPITGDTGYTLQVSSASFDFDTIDTDPYVETETAYNATNLILVACATPVSRAIWSMMAMFLRHEHNKGNVQDAVISHTDLVNANPPNSEYTGTGPKGVTHNTVFPAHLPAWAPSYWPHDPHTSLLSRVGSQASGYERDKFNNAMLGHLVMANADTSGAENYIDGTLPNGSFKIYFGDVASPSIYGSNSTTITVDSDLSILDDAWINDTLWLGGTSGIQKTYIQDGFLFMENTTTLSAPTGFSGWAETLPA